MRRTARTFFRLGALMLGGEVLCAALVAPGAAPEMGLTTMQAFGIGLAGLLVMAWPVTLLGLGGFVVGGLMRLAARYEPPEAA